MRQLHRNAVWRSSLVVSVLVFFTWGMQAQQNAHRAPPTPVTHQPLPRGQEREDARFNAISAVQDIDSRIRFAERFLDDFPLDTRRDSVFEVLDNAYCEKQDWA